MNFYCNPTSIFQDKKLFFFNKENIPSKISKTSIVEIIIKNEQLFNVIT